MSFSTHKISLRKDIQSDLRPLPWDCRYMVGRDGSIWRRLAESRKCSSNGYMYCHVRDKNGRPANMLLHRVICETFNGQAPFDGAIVRHMNGDRSDNRPENLVWGTYEENIGDAKRHGTFGEGDRHYRDKIGSKIVKVIRGFLERNGSATGASSFLCRWFGLTPNDVSKIKRGKTWKGCK